MQTETLLADGKYQKALEVGKESLESDANLLMLRMYALARQNALGEKLFEYPISANVEQMLPTSGRTRMYYCPEDSLYKFLGGRPAEAMTPMHFLDLLERRDSIVPRQVIDYKLCGLLIDRQIDHFAREIGKYYPLDDHLPKHYREALVLYTHSRSNPVVVYHHAVTEGQGRGPVSRHLLVLLQISAMKKIYKAHILYTKERSRFEILENGYVTVDADGLVTGVASDLASLDSQDAEVTDFGDCLLIPAMNDLHVHAPQYRNQGIAMDLELLPWLQNYTFPEEMKYASLDYAALSATSGVSVPCGPVSSPRSIPRAPVC